MSHIDGNMSRGAYDMRDRREELTIGQEILHIHLPNLAVFGFMPTLLLWALSADFAEFKERIESFRTADPLVYYFGALFLLAVVATWSGAWVWIVSPVTRRLVQNVCSALQSIYYVVSGISLGAAIMLAPTISNWKEVAIVGYVLVIGVLFSVVAIVFPRILPPTMRG